jgi:phosphoribosylanthranilate isomerase
MNLQAVNQAGIQIDVQMRVQMGVQIKICGITRVADAEAAIELGAHMLGLNFYPRSPRCVSLPQAQQIARAVAGRAQLVGVFVNMDVSAVLEIARQVPLEAVQLHGDESVADCEAIAAEFPVIRALKVDAAFGPALAAQYASCRALLLDTPCAGHGGSGESFDWEAVPWESVRGAVPHALLLLAGGLDAGNVGRAIAIARPGAVDVCSGVESEKGIKSVEKMREFVAAVRAAERLEQ